LLLLDDIASELDEEHLSRVLHAGLNLGVQVWLTGTEMVPAIESCTGDSAVFHVKQGVVLETS
jgi:recombinational DNA repair ATPase RecF